MDQKTPVPVEAGTSLETSGDQIGAKTSTDNTENKMVVMVAVDESQGSLYALSWALDNLLPMTANTSSWLLFHAEQPLHHYMHPVGPDAAVYATPSLIESVRQAQQQNSKHLLDKALRICHDKGVTAETLAMEGDAKDMICQAAEQMHVDLLIVGSRGLGTFKRAFLGSVSDYCAHHARCPVLIVKPQKADH
ncbi:hypothetical protein LUZ60_005554 [Juncus effusus]|nr:hypothetical protein LUZ60_005554 [Juncus effusus]